MQNDKDKHGEADASSSHPKWWSSDHHSAWTRIKEAMRRDWEQTKHDFNRNAGRELHQSAGDTVKQMAGKEPVDAEWSTHEPATRFGYGAGRHYGDRQFDAHESVLKREWEALKSGRLWSDVREHVRRGWDWSRRKD